MSEVVSTKNARAGSRWPSLAIRVASGVMLFIFLVCLLLSLAGIVGVWVALLSERRIVTDISTTTTHVLTTVDNNLTLVNTQVQDARQSLTLVNEIATKVGNHIRNDNPLVSVLSQFIQNNVAPRVEKVRTTALSIHDSVVSFNGTLVAINRLPGVNVPTLDNQLSAVSERAQAAQAAYQDLRTAMENVKAGLVTQFKDVITNVTSRIDAPLAKIQEVVTHYQVTVVRTQNRVTSTRDMIITWSTVLVVCLTIIFAAYAVGQLLLLAFGWRSMRTGRFSSRTNYAPLPAIHAEP